MSLLIKGGQIVTFKIRQDAPAVFQADILVEKDIIKQIDSNIAAPEGATVIDASSHIVAPGFIDTHRHVYQAISRAFCGDHTLQEYLYKHLWAPEFLSITADEGYIGQLAGALEAIHAGVTTVVDHANLFTTEEHVNQLLSATVESGIRSFYCYTRNSNPSSVTPLEFGNEEQTRAWQIPHIMRLVQPGGIPGNSENRVVLGLAYDVAAFGPPEAHLKILNAFRDASKHAGTLITAHAVYGTFGEFNLIEYWDKQGLLGPDVLFSHCNNNPSPASTWEIIHKADAGISSTPEDELAMSHGDPVAFDARSHGVRTGLGVDVVSAVSGDLFTAMRFALQHARGTRHAALWKEHKFPHHLKARAADALRLATLGGAEAIHRESSIGSLEVGKKADLILVRKDSPSMAGSWDPVQALVLMANVGDVETVVINGEVLKRDGKFVRHDWPSIAKRLEQARQRIAGQLTSQEELQKVHDKATGHSLLVN